MPYAAIGGNDLFYARSESSGPDVVLIHGAGGNHLVWPPTLRRLPGASVYAIDLSGHGRSNGDGHAQITDYAAEVIRFLDAVELDQTVLIGHSMGGAIAQAVALIAPERVAKLALLSTGARLRVSDALLEKLAQDPEGAAQMIAKWAWAPGAELKMISQSIEMMLETEPAALLNDFVACNQFDVRDLVSQIDKPTIVLTGAEDKMTPPALGEWLSQQIPRARFFPIPNAGHMVMLEQPGMVGEKISAFVFQG